MAMLVAFSTLEGYVLVVDGLGPFLIMVFQGNGSREGLGYIEIDTDASIGHVPSLFGGFRRLDIDVDGVVDTSEDFF
jgi:hypothetical protein